MDHYSYWRKSLDAYLMARQRTFLIMGVALMAVTLISILTGTCLVKYEGFVYRAEDPKKFWEAVGTYCVLGLICLGFYLYTIN
jgi:hypothetical protein